MSGTAMGGECKDVAILKIKSERGVRFMILDVLTVQKLALLTSPLVTLL
jgi:hypothetical protein